MVKKGPLSILDQRIAQMACGTWVLVCTSSSHNGSRRRRCRSWLTCKREETLIELGLGQEKFCVGEGRP